MELKVILVFVLAALFVRFFLQAEKRKWVLLVFSILAVYWLQPVTPIRYLDFWLPTLTISLVLLMWFVTTSKEKQKEKENLFGLGVVLGLILLVALTRYVSYSGVLTQTRPPQTLQVVLGFLLLAGSCFGISRVVKRENLLIWISFAFLLFLFAILKLPILSLEISRFLRNIMQQSPELAAATDLRWLGYSYVAFRLLHVLRDRQKGRFPDAGLVEFVIYVVFFPSLSAGPIDRLERFTKDLQKKLDFSSVEFAEAGKRLLIGLFKKFVLADTLALIALNQTNAVQQQGSAWAWLLLYAYSFQIYFDFSGYTDITIGVAQIMGIKLPENFNHPYLKPNLTIFWNNWHMTLTQWFRAYFFNPITRSLRRSKKKFSPFSILLITQIGTMLLIGLWHGITWNFVFWGLWHGIGLLVQNRWSDWVKPKMGNLETKPGLNRLVNVSNVLLTFHYVALGWVWFALPNLKLSLLVFQKLFGLL